MDLSDWHLWFKRRGGRQLQTLLMDEWEPIGVRGVPEAIDEYDTYVARIGTAVGAVDSQVDRESSPASDIEDLLAQTS